MSNFTHPRNSVMGWKGKVDMYCQASERRDMYLVICVSAVLLHAQYDGCMIMRRGMNRLQRSIKLIAAATINNSSNSSSSSSSSGGSSNSSSGGSQLHRQCMNNAEPSQLYTLFDLVLLSTVCYYFIGVCLTSLYIFSRPTSHSRGRLLEL